MWITVHAVLTRGSPQQPEFEHMHFVACNDRKAQMLSSMYHSGLQGIPSRVITFSKLNVLENDGDRTHESCVYGQISCEIYDRRERSSCLSRRSRLKTPSPGVLYTVNYGSRTCMNEGFSKKNRSLPVAYERRFGVTRGNTGVKCVGACDRDNLCNSHSRPVSCHIL